MFRVVLLALIGCGFALPLSLEAVEPEYPAVEFIRRIGGKEERDESFPSRPLVKVNLAQSRISDEGIKELHPLKDLAHLRLCKTKITDEGLKDLPAIKTLLELDLSETEITDKGIDELAKIEKLHTLDLSGTKITGEGIKKLAGFKRLESISLYETAIPQDVLKTLAKNPKLVCLAFDNEHLTDEVFRICFEAKRLHTLSQAGVTNLYAQPKNDDKIQSFSFEGTKVSKKEGLKLWELKDYGAHGRERKKFDDEDFELIVKYNKTERIQLFIGSQSQKLFQEVYINDQPLRYLDLIDTKITEDSFKNFHKIPKLTGIKLPATQPSEKGWKELGLLSELIYLHLRNTELNADAVREIGKLKKLKYLEMPITKNNDKFLPQLKKLLPECKIIHVRPDNGETVDAPQKIIDGIEGTVPPVPAIPALPMK